MPTQTFFNLPDEKKQRIIQAAITEFSLNVFEKCSIAKIVENAGIPRGSFYQYFSDLKDLYNHIFTLVSEKKLDYIYQNVPEIAREDFDFFQILRSLYVAGIEFAEENPELTAIGNNFFKESTSFKRQIMEQQQLKAEQFFIELIQKGIKQGQIDTTININLTSYLLVSLNISLIDFYFMQFKAIDILDEKEALLHLVDDMLYLITKGIGKKDSLVENPVSGGE